MDKVKSAPKKLIWIPLKGRFQSSRCSEGFIPLPTKCLPYVKTSLSCLQAGNMARVQRVVHLTVGWVVVESAEEHQKRLGAAYLWWSTGSQVGDACRDASPGAATRLILPDVICLSQRLSHACLSPSDVKSETANGSLNQSQFTRY